jgi:DNA processing protein
MSDVVIVVEAAERGGALITADIANSYNRDVMAVPGNLGQSHSEGCNYLIKDHKAHIYTGINSLEALMNWQEGAPAAGKTQPDWPDESLTEEEKQVVLLLRHQKEMLLDDLSWQSQIALGKLASLLLTLELRGVVKALPGKRFMLA